MSAPQPTCNTSDEVRAYYDALDDAAEAERLERPARGEEW